MIDLTCPQCGKASVSPTPDVNCGDCLMDRTDIVKMVDARLTEYIAIGPHCWGRGDNERQAVRYMMQNIPFLEVRDNKRKLLHYVVYRVAPGAEVTGHGSIEYGLDDPAPVEVRRK